MFNWKEELPLCLNTDHGGILDEEVNLHTFNTSHLIEVSCQLYTSAVVLPDKLFILLLLNKVWLGSITDMGVV